MSTNNSLPPLHQIFDLPTTKLIAILSRTLPALKANITSPDAKYQDAAELEEYQELIEAELDERQTTYDWIEKEMANRSHSASEGLNTNQEESVKQQKEAPGNDQSKEPQQTKPVSSSGAPSSSHQPITTTITTTTKSTSSPKRKRQEQISPQNRKRRESESSFVPKDKSEKHHSISPTSNTTNRSESMRRSSTTTSTATHSPKSPSNTSPNNGQQQQRRIYGKMDISPSSQRSPTNQLTSTSPSSGGQQNNKRHSIHSNFSRHSLGTGSPTNHQKQQDKKLKYEIHKDVYQNPEDNLPKTKLTDQIKKTVSAKLNTRATTVTHMAKTGNKGGFFIINPNRLRRDMLLKQKQKKKRRKKKKAKKSDDDSSSTTNARTKKRKPPVPKANSKRETKTNLGTTNRSAATLPKRNSQSAPRTLNTGERHITASTTPMKKPNMLHSLNRSSSESQLLPSIREAEKDQDTEHEEEIYSSETESKEKQTEQENAPPLKEEAKQDEVKDESHDSSEVKEEDIPVVSDEKPDIVDTDSPEKEHPKITISDASNAETDSNELTEEASVADETEILEEEELEVHYQKLDSPPSDKHSPVVLNENSSDDNTHDTLSNKKPQPILISPGNRHTSMHYKIHGGMLQTLSRQFPSVSTQMQKSTDNSQPSNTSPRKVLVESDTAAERGSQSDTESVESVALSDIDSTESSRTDAAQPEESLSALEVLGRKTAPSRDDAQIRMRKEKKSSNHRARGFREDIEKQIQSYSKRLKVKQKPSADESTDTEDSNSQSSTSQTKTHSVYSSVKKSRKISIFERKISRKKLYHLRELLLSRLSNEESFQSKTQLTMEDMNGNYFDKLRESVEDIDPVFLLKYLEERCSSEYKQAQQQILERCSAWKRIIPDKVDYSRLYTSFYDIFTATHRPEIHELNTIMNNRVKRTARISSDNHDQSHMTLLTKILEELDQWLKMVPRESGHNELYSCILDNREEVHEIVSQATTRNTDSNWTPNPPNNDMWNLYWSWSKPQVNRHKLLIWQKVNHFCNAKQLTSKDFLKRSIDRFIRVPGRRRDEFSIMPPTFSLPHEYIKLVESYAENEGKPWIVKPIGFSRGRGIRIVTDIARVDHNEHVVVQRYIENPLLLDGLKWDLRIYVLVTHFEPLEAFIYTDGFARFASEKFTLDPQSFKDLFIHLTNTSIQQKAMKGTQKILISQLQKRLEAQGYDWNVIWNRIVTTIVKSLVCVEDLIAEPKSASDARAFDVNSFEVFGYDVLITEQLDCWLLEVNASPSMEKHAPIDELKDELIRDTMTLLDPVYFDRFALKCIIERRLKGKKKRSYHRSSMHTQSELNDDLKAILHGRMPRSYGELPEKIDATKYKRIAPGSLYNKYKKISGK